MTPAFLLIDAWTFQLDEVDLPVFSADVARAETIIEPAKRRRQAQARSLARRVLALRLAVTPEEIAFEIAPAGKPHVKGCEFSISHSGPWLVVATADMPVGVDVESQSPRQNPIDLAKRFFSVSDAARLLRADEAERDGLFLQQWVAKEAALKAAGVGLQMYLNRAECVYEKGAIRTVRWSLARREVFSIHEFVLPDGTPGALAWRNGEAILRWRNPAEVNVS